MIRQRFSIPRYGWRVKVWYAVDDCYTEEIVRELRLLGADSGFIRESCAMLDGGMLNQGLTVAMGEIEGARGVETPGSWKGMEGKRAMGMGKLKDKIRGWGK